MAENEIVAWWFETHEDALLTMRSGAGFAL
jgi:hypothetical protein